MSNAVGAQAIDLSQPSPFLGYEESILEQEGYIAEGGSLNFPYLIAQSEMIGNAATVGQFFNPQNYDSGEVGPDSMGFGSGNYTGKGGQGAVGGTTIWW